MLDIQACTSVCPILICKSRLHLTISANLDSRTNTVFPAVVNLIVSTGWLENARCVAFEDGQLL